MHFRCAGTRGWKFFGIVRVRGISIEISGTRPFWAMSQNLSPESHLELRLPGTHIWESQGWVRSISFEISGNRTIPRDCPELTMALPIGEFAANHQNHSISRKFIWNRRNSTPGFPYLRSRQNKKMPGIISFWKNKVNLPGTLLQFCMFEKTKNRY